jgi:uncharacterized membrane protein
MEGLGVARRNPDLLLVAVLAVAGLLAGLAVNLSPLIRGIFSTPLVIALPGYALTAALIPDRQALGRTERTLFGVGLSIVVTILVALGLNQLPAGITNLTVAVSLAAVTLGCVVVGLVRRRSGATTDTGAEPGESAVEVRREAPSRFGPELLALAVILTVAAVFVGVLGTIRAPEPGFTELWLVNGTAANSVQVGIRNQEGTDLSYRLEIETAGQVLKTAQIDLASGQQTVQTIQLPPLTGTSPESVTARLYRLDQPAASPPYRTTLLWRYPGPS